MEVNLIYSPVYLKHDTGNHPENAERLRAVVSHLDHMGVMERLVKVEPPPASREELALIHSRGYIEKIRALAGSGGGWLDMDTVVSPDSFEAARYAAGALVEATRMALDEGTRPAFCLVRPPGHHAGPDRGMGFCIFNNVGIAAAYSLEIYGLQRVAIIDFDVHHGNGTQEAFYTDPRVCYLSVHQYPHYPGTGRVEETGSGEASGTNINVPLPAGCGDIEYAQVFEKIVVPAIERFRPELILVSAGYDAHRNDRLAMMQVTTGGFASMVETIKGLAGKLCPGRLVFGLEGGYDLPALADSIKACLDVLMGEPARSTAPAFARPPDSHAQAVIEKVCRIHSL